MLAGEAASLPPLSYVVLPALIAGGLTIVGAFVNNWLSKRREQANHKRGWEQDHRLDAYAAVAAAVGVLLHESLRRFIIKRASGETTSEDDLNRTLEALTQINGALFLVQVLGPAEVAGYAKVLVSEARGLAAMVGSDTSWEKYHEKADKVEVLLDAFVDAARWQIQEVG